MSSNTETADGSPGKKKAVRDVSTRALMRRLIGDRVRHYVRPLVIAAFFMAVVAAATALSAYLMEPVVNDLFIARDRDKLWLVGGAIVATFLVKGAANYAQITLMSYVGFKIVADFQKQLFAHLARMDVGFFQRRKTGDLVSRFSVDLNAMRVAVSDALTTLGKDLLSLIFLIGVMFYQDAELAVIAFLVFPLAIYPIYRLGRRLRKAVVIAQGEMGQMTTLTSQTFQGIRLVKAYRMEAYEQSRLDRIVDTIFRLSLKAASSRALSSPVMETLGGIAVGLVVVYGGYRVIENATDAGSFFSFITALLMAYEPAKRLANLNASVQAGLAGAERMYDVLDTEPEVRDAPDAGPLKVDGGAVRIDNVTFAYGADSDQPALRAVDIDIPAGATVALVGPSGAGKTTVLNLIPRFFDTDSGAVLIDGQDVRGVTHDSLMQAIGLVSQEVTLFDDTIRNNIAFGRPDASDAEIEAAAKAAAAHDFVTAMPDGYDTVVGEQGAKLSGGQRQRIAIARAILKDAPILLLDEATSALDSESERHVRDALDHLMTDRTSVVIAHRLSTVQHADIIYVLDQGAVVEKGTHEELLASGGHYARYYAMQFGRADNDSVADLDGDAAGDPAGVRAAGA
ncbi:MAG: ABC transporter transmembrane domain-containing protein [Rhodospirillales bacterium]